MPGSTPALLQSIYTAYREKRLADVLALLTDDFQFTLHLPAESLPGAGAPHGKADTAKLLEGLIATYDFLDVRAGPDHGHRRPGGRARPHPLSPQGHGRGDRDHPRPLLRASAATKPPSSTSTTTSSTWCPS